MEKVQNGSFWVNGTIREPSQISVPLMSSAILRAMAVFDGMIATRRNNDVVLIAGEEHILRFLYSAKALDINILWSKDDILAASIETARREMEKTGGNYVYVRPMALGANLAHSENDISLTIACFAQPAPSYEVKSIRAITSPWRRASGSSMPPGVKSVANYQLTRIARQQARSAGFDDAIILNSAGRVAEGAGSAVLVEREGKLFSPPDWEDCLPSVTVNILEELSACADIPFERKPISLAELYGSDAVSFVGTLSDLIPISQIDYCHFTKGVLIPQLRKLFISALQNGDPSLKEWRL